MSHRARAGALAFAVVSTILATTAGATILDGVQPAALDQPQINMILYVGSNTLPQTGVTSDPLGGLLGGPTEIPFFNVQAYLDTGASSILVSSPTAAALHIATELVGGVPVIYSDVGVAGTDDFSVSVPVRLALAPFIPGVDMDQFADVAQTIPITTPYTPVPPPPSGTLRVQVGPYVPPVDSTGLDEIDQLIQELSNGGSALDVVGMPAMKGRVMVIDPSGVKDLGLLFDVLGGVLNGTGDITDLTDAQLNSIGNAGVATYLYNRATAPAFDPHRAGDPGIPTAQRHVALSYGSFDRFTKVSLGPGGVPNPTLPAPTLEHNPFIGKNPVALMEGLPAGNNPGITISRTVGALTLPSTGNWLLDTGAAASIISETQAGALNVIYDVAHGHGPGLPDTATPVLVDKVSGIVLPDQFTLVLGGIGGQEILSGFWVDSLKLPTKEATASGDDSLNIYFSHVPVLVGNITVADPLDPSKTLTLDGIFGMNMLIESINIQTDATGNLTDLGAPSPSFFKWITFDEPNAELGLVFDPSAVPGMAGPIDHGQLYFTTADLTSGAVTPNFAGGTLRTDVAGTFAQAFSVGAAGGIIDTYGNAVTFAGGGLAGPGGLTITDSLHPVNGGGGGTLMLGEAATYLGNTTITSGATVKLIAGGALAATNLVLNGSFLLNNFSQTVASLAGTDPTAVLDLGATGSFTINGSLSTVFAGAIVNSATPGAQGPTPAVTGVSTLALKGGAKLTLTGNNTYTGPTTLDSGTALALGSGGHITQTSSVVNAGSVRVGAGAGLSAGQFTQSGSGSTLLTGGVITSPTVNINGGVFGGNGTVNGNVMLASGVLQVGLSPDPLHIVGNFTQTGGTIAFEIDPNGSGGFLMSTLIFDPGATLSVGGATVTFNFKNGADPLAFFNSGAFNLDTFLGSSDGHKFSSEFPVGSLFQGDTFMATSTDFNITAFSFAPGTGATSLAQQAVPEPASLALLAAGTLALLTRRPRKAGR